MYTKQKINRTVPFISFWVSVFLIFAVSLLTPRISNAYTLVAAPNLSAPADGAPNVSTTPQFSWSAVTGANLNGYKIAVATSIAALPTDPTATSCSGNCVINAVPVSGTTYTPPSALNANTTYYWSVRAVPTAATVFGNWSTIRSFTTQAAPAAPTLSSISPNVITQGAGSQTVTFTGTGFTASSWPHFTTSLGASQFATVAPTNITSTSMTVTVNNTSAQTITWKVCASNGSSVCSNTQTVTVQPAAPATPTLSSISPNVITQGTGSQTVTFTGTGFTASSWPHFTTSLGASQFATVAPTNITSTSMTVTVNNTSAQTITWKVCASNGSSVCSNTQTVTVQPALSLTGYVYDETSDLPLDKVLVTVGTVSAYTNSSGRYTISNLTNTNYTIQASLSGYATRNFTGINPAYTYTYSFTLTQNIAACAAGTLSGVVSDTGHPGVGKGGVQVTLLSNGSSIQTDINTGYYSFPNVAPGPVTVSFAFQGYAAYSYTIKICGNKTQNVSITPYATVQGLNVPSALSKDPVNTATGNYIYQRNDLTLPGKGLAFSLERNYNSQAASDPGTTSGPFGFGWTHNYNTSLTVDGGGNVTVNWGDGKTESYTPDGAGGFTAKPGVFDTLIANAGGTYTLKKKDLTNYNFDATNHLASIVDRNGNTIALTYTGSNLTRITDTAGRNVDFTYDAGNRIVTITDPIARTAQFTYDSAGNLATTQDRNGKITTYSYDASHQITSVTDPRGNMLVTNVYAANQVVASQRDAKGGQTIYTYDPNHKTTVTMTDALNNVVSVSVDYHDDLLRFAPGRCQQQQHAL